VKALQIVAPRHVKVVDLPIPQIERPDQVLVRLHATSICNMHEWRIYTDHYRAHFKCKYPLEPGYPGHEGCGEVVQVGSDVSTLNVGDKVFLTSHAGYLHSEYVVCSGGWAIRLEPHTSWADAAPLELFASALGLLENGEHIAGYKSVVIGAGPAGLAVVQVLRALQCNEIVVVDLIDARLAKALEIGADLALNASSSKALEDLAQLEPETVVDCSGSHEGLKLALGSARKEAVLFGYNDEPFEVLQAEWFVKSLVIRTGNVIDQDIAKRAALLLKHGFICPSALVSHRLPFGEAGYAEAMNLVERRACNKVLIEHAESP